jgi:hypothetical protein
MGGVATPGGYSVNVTTAFLRGTERFFSRENRYHRVPGRPRRYAEVVCILVASRSRATTALARRAEPPGPFGDTFGSIQAGGPSGASDRVDRGRGQREKLLRGVVR